MDFEVALLPLANGATERLYQFACESPDDWPRLTAGSESLQPLERFHQLLWREVTSQHLIAERDPVADESRVFALVALYNADSHNGTVDLDYVEFEAAAQDDSLTRAVDAVLGFAFGSWPFRKVYLPRAEYQPCGLTGPLKDAFRQEARFVDAHYAEGRYWDRIVCTLDREDYQTFGATREA